MAAGKPLCCQQRPVPRTWRWQGVPFFVSAPQVETISGESVGRAGAMLAADVSGLAVAVELPVFVFTGGSCACAVCAGVMLGWRRSMMSGGGVGRRAPPASKPMIKSARLANVGNSNRAPRSLGAQSGQKRRLVQRCQRERMIRSPHSAQKFGLYTVRASIEKQRQPETYS
jgi:hypothetical protein